MGLPPYPCNLPNSTTHLLFWQETGKEDTYCILTLHSKQRNYYTVWTVDKATGSLSGGFYSRRLTQALENFNERTENRAILPENICFVDNGVVQYMWLQKDTQGYITAVGMNSEDLSPSDYCYRSQEEALADFDPDDWSGIEDSDQLKLCRLTIQEVDDWHELRGCHWYVMSGDGSRQIVKGPLTYEQAEAYAEKINGQVVSLK